MELRGKVPFYPAQSSPDLDNLPDHLKWQVVDVRMFYDNMRYIGFDKMPQVIDEVICSYVML